MTLRSVTTGTGELVSRSRGLLKAVWTDGFVRRLAKDSSWGVGATAVEFALSLAEIALVARALGASDYGRLALVIAAITSIKLVIDVRAWEAATRYLTEFLARRELGLGWATVKFSLIGDSLVGVIAYLTTLALAGPLSTWMFHAPALKSPIRWYALSLLFTAANGTGEAVLRVFDRFRDLAIRQVVQAGLHLVLIIAAVLLEGGHLQALIVAYLLADLGGAAILVGLAARQVGQRLWPARADGRLGTLRPYLRDMLWFTVQSAVRATLKLDRQIGLLILGHFSSPDQVGYYRVARRLGSSIQQLSDPVYYAVFPEFARIRARRPAQFVGVVMRTATATILGVLPILIPTVLFAPVLIRLWVGSAYIPAVGPVRWILLAMGLSMATLWGTPAALASGRPEIATYAVAAGVLVDLALLLLLVPHYGAMGAAISLVGGNLALTVTIVTLLARALRTSQRATRESRAVQKRAA